MSNETFETETLEALAKKITQYATEADESTIKAAFLVREARLRVEAGDAGDTTWEDWAVTNIKLSPSRRRELQQIAKADDPGKELERIRGMTQKRVAEHRAKTKSASLRNGGDTARQAVQLAPEREQLIEIARSAPLSHIEKLLSLAQELAAENATMASDHDVEHVGVTDPGEAAPEAAGSQLAAE